VYQSAKESQGKLKEAMREIAGCSRKAGRFEKAATPEDQNSRPQE
jgi:hypothetical protein